MLFRSATPSQDHHTLPVSPGIVVPNTTTLYKGILLFNMEPEKPVETPSSSETAGNLYEKAGNLEQQHAIVATDLDGAPRRQEDDDAPPDESPAQQRSITGFRWFLVCLAIFSANLLYGLDTTISADIQGAVCTSKILCLGAMLDQLTRKMLTRMNVSQRSSLTMSSR